MFCRRPGIALLSTFFALGAVIACVTAAAILFPGSRLDVLWRLNPQAHVAFLRAGAWAAAGMFVVSLACALSAIGLWTCAPWGRRLALALLTVNLAGDGINGVLRDPRTLIGLPIAGALIAYLMSHNVRARFEKKVSDSGPSSATWNE